ncbi:MAG: hypothetical protein WB041_24365, partial [Pseudolabrys sp.]
AASSDWAARIITAGLQDRPPGPMSALGGSGRAAPKEEVRVGPKSEVEHPICCDLRGRHSAIRPC